jgi:hypothetical protein
MLGAACKKDIKILAAAKQAAWLQAPGALLRHGRAMAVAGI